MHIQNMMRSTSIISLEPLECARRSFTFEHPSSRYQRRGQTSSMVGVRCLLAQAVLLCLASAAPTNETTSAAVTSLSATAAVSSPAAAAVSSLTYAASATSLLPVPTYSTQPAFSTATASAIAASLPGYTYNLTSESLATREGICNQTVSYCAMSGCSIPTANVTTNFCNYNTLGWNCLCNGGATSRLQPPIVPVNSYDCKLRASACSLACTNPSAVPAIKSIAACQNACSYIIGSTCSTNTQVIPEYQVAAYSDTPKYYPNTSGGGVASGITVKSFANRVTLPLGTIVFAFIVSAFMVLA